MSVDDLRAVVAVALALFLIILRVDAPRLGAAEYDEPDEDGRRPPFLPRLGWYLTGIALAVLIAMVHPDPGRALLLGLGSDRTVAFVVGLAFGAVGAAYAVVVALLRYGRLRLPGPIEYPGAVLNALGTATVDEAAFRGVILGLLLTAGVPASAAIITQALVYVLATRVGGPGRPLYIVLFTLVLGLAAGWVTVVTGGVGAAFIGDAITRLAIFLTTGHAAILAPRGREVEEIASQRLPPPGWRVVGDEEPDGE